MQSVTTVGRLSEFPVVAVVATGGTIANTPSGRIGVEQVVADIRERFPTSDPEAFARLTIREVCRAGAGSFTSADWTAIAKAVATEAAKPAVVGVVVTHGTYTAEETAYFLHLVVGTEKPVVVACSQRKHGTIGNDGDKNLLDAIRLASDPTAAGRGTMVVLDEEIHSARDVTKTSQRPGGFSSGSLGLLGSLEADGATFYRAPTRRHGASSELKIPDTELPRVDIVATYAGADGAAVQAFVDAGAAGIVVNGFAFSGTPHPLQMPALARAVEQRVAVVLVNRGGDGRVPVVTNDGFVRGDNLSAQKARILLSLALTQTSDRHELQRFFSEY